MNSKLFAAIAAIVLAVAAGMAYHYHPKVHTLKELQASTVSVTVTGGVCSGWVFAGQKAVITAAHCVARWPADPVYVDFHDGTGNHLFHVTKIGQVEGTLPDLTILTSTDTKIHWPAGLSLCNFKPYYLEETLMFGDPLGFTQAITRGRVANPSQTVPQARDEAYIQYDGALSPGNSGGAVVDIEYQCVIGVADALLPDSEGGSAVNFLEIASRLGELK